MNMVLDMIGWVGTLLIVAAYYLISCGKLKTDSWMYQIMNLAGAVAVGASVFSKQAWPALVLEIVWAGIALIALIRILQKH